jgi:hypothetical protein
MSPASRLDGTFDAWVNQVGSSYGLATAVSQILLIHGRSICNSVDPQAYRCLIDNVIKRSGVGKGVFLATLNEMPEAFSRTQLKLWDLEGTLVGISEATWQAALKHALCDKRLTLALDIMKMSEARYGKNHVVQVLSELDMVTFSGIRVLALPYTESLVHALCAQRSFKSAITHAGSDKHLKDVVMRSIGYEIGLLSRPRSWPDLMSYMIKKSRAGDNQSDILDQYKSAGSVVIEQILSMDEFDIRTYLKSDQLRLMAFHWGLEGAVKDIDSMRVKGEALEHALGL